MLAFSALVLNSNSLAINSNNSNHQSKSTIEATSKMTDTATQNQDAGDNFLAENSMKEGVKTTDSGLQYKIIEEGSGKSPSPTDMVTVNYEGTLINGTVFDSSYKRGEPISFPVNGVIQGWQEALPMMKEGATWMLYIPSELAYGPRGAGGIIGPNETLIFKVELIKVN